MSKQHKQEVIGSDWLDMARREAAIEREMKVDKWVKVSIVAFTSVDSPSSDGIVLHQYDLPRSMWFKYD